MHGTVRCAEVTVPSVVGMLDVHVKESIYIIVVDFSPKNWKVEY